MQTANLTGVNCHTTNEPFLQLRFLHLRLEPQLREKQPSRFVSNRPVIGLYSSILTEYPKGDLIRIVEDYIKLNPGFKNEPGLKWVNELNPFQGSANVEIFAKDNGNLMQSGGRPYLGIIIG